MASSIERRGVHHCGEIAERNNWMFREQPIDDVGIDAHMEFIESTGKPTSCITNKIWIKLVQREKRQLYYFSIY